MKSIHKILAVAVMACALLLNNAALARKGGGKSSASADYRSAKSGQYVKKTYAQRNKSTTVREQRSKK